MKTSVLVGFVILAIVVLIYITRQQRGREGFEVDTRLAAELTPLNTRLSVIQKKQEKVQDAVNAGAGRAMINGIE